MARGRAGRDSAAPPRRPWLRRPCRRQDRSPGLSAPGADEPPAPRRDARRQRRRRRSRAGEGVCRSLLQETWRHEIWDESTGRRLSIRFRQKKTPAAIPRGFSLVSWRGTEASAADIGADDLAEQVPFLALE